MSLLRTGLRGFSRPSRRVIVSLAMLLSATTVVFAIVTDLGLVGQLHDPRAEHADQDELKALVVAGQTEEAFEETFEKGDELFETVFNALDGVGANVGDGQRFTRVPRADLDAAGQWATHTPARATGPNAQACNSCHNQPSDDGAGAISGNVHRDPFHTANLKSFIQRNTPHVFAPGAVQRLAEEMSGSLERDRERAKDLACDNGSATVALDAKGISFGWITAVRTSSHPCRVQFDTDRVRGVDADLLIRPFQWKGSVAFVRDFNRGASHNELGMQAVEIAGDGVDGDHDGVVDEMTIGDQTALAVYLSAQPRPTTRTELASLGLIPPLSAEELGAIERGAGLFRAVGCASCHVARLTLDEPTFSEPSQSPRYRDSVFPAGQDPVARGVDPRFPVTFDLTHDQPDNQIKDAAGNVVFRLGSLKKDSQGRAVVELFGDLRRHDIGARLAENIDEVGTGKSVFLTENLWGVGSTAPYLHDGRATTLTEAILEHGGEAATERNAFRALPLRAQKDVLAFLDNLVLFKLEPAPQP